MIYNFYDWDDTIIDSRYAIFLSYKQAMKEIINYNLKYDEFNEKLYQDSTKYITSLGFSTEISMQIKELKNYYYIHKFFKRCKVLLDNFNNKDTNFIVTNTTSDVVNLISEKLNICKNIDKVIGTDIEPNIKRKPFPDLYNYAFNEVAFNFDSKRDCVIIYEDSEAGLEAATAFYHENSKLLHNFRIVYTPRNYSLAAAPKSYTYEFTRSFI